MRSPGRIIGPALTVKMVEMSDTSSPKPLKHFADYNEAGKIMYIQQPNGLYSACWGGLMSTRARFLGAAGVVVDGRIRDIREHIEKEFPVSLITIWSRRLGSDELILHRSSLGTRLSWGPTRSLAPRRSMFPYSSRGTSGLIPVTF